MFGCCLIDKPKSIVYMQKLLHDALEKFLDGLKNKPV